MTNPVDWYENLPEALKEAPYLKPQDDGSPRTIEQVVADLQNAAKVQGNLSESHIKVPSPDAAESDIEAFRERVLGLDPNLVRKPEDFSPVPEEATGYQDIDIEGFEPGEGDLDQVKQIALESKWTQSQYEAALHRIAKDQAESKLKRADWLQAQDKVLSEKLGLAKQDHIARTVAMLQESSPELAKALSEGTLDASVTLALDGLVHKIIEMGGEGREFNQQAGAGARELTPEEAWSKADEVRDELSKMQPYQPGYQAKLNKLVEYQRIASAG